MTVHPGDWMVADSEGILCLPAAVKAKILCSATGKEAPPLTRTLSA
ncbi:MAG: hypothetical protein Q4C67_00735 [Deinococcus sp.]|nr:hypothetical protein [Deinococcus sp.]